MRELNNNKIRHAFLYSALWTEELEAKRLLKLNNSIHISDDVASNN